jgi:hypothetical protein
MDLLEPPIPQELDYLLDLCKLSDFGVAFLQCAVLLVDEVFANVGEDAGQSLYDACKAILWAALTERIQKIF